MQIQTLFSEEMIILIRRCITKLLCLAILLIVLLGLIKSLYKNPEVTHVSVEDLIHIQIASTEYPYFSYQVDEPHTAVFQKKRLFYKSAAPASDMPQFDYYTYALLYEDHREIRLRYNPAVNEVYNIEYQRVEPSAGLKEVLLDLAAVYLQEINKTYGSLLVWDEVNELFPMYATAKITDIYTGESFTVQRREGSSHVDAQPLTAEDSAIMKKIYDGQWSWERKGIIVDVQGYRIAASMHGMPHGGGKIDDNNFPGHFCIHFLGSTIHNGGMDSGHHREILKAAGKLPLDDF